MDGQAIQEQNLLDIGGKSLVYVREVIARDVMDELTEDGSDETMDIPEETILYALHAADGERIALVSNRDLAFAAARQNEMNPVSVH